jgi:Zn finger protein HypA/HybF involved in hydrogenase expression
MTWRWPIISFLFPGAASVALGFSPARTPLTASPNSAAEQASSRPVPICASCHEEGKTQPATSMGRALESVEECTTFASHPLLTFKDGKYSYRIERRGSQGLYTVSDGHQSLTLLIRWVMGASFGIGQTYILEKDGKFYQSRVSYYRELKRLDLTLGVLGGVPRDLVEAAGLVMNFEDELRCFSCHATNATEGRKITLAVMTPGVQCEHCHGPTEKHVQWATKGGSPPVLPNDLSKLSTDQLASFCGQCHRTLLDVLANERYDITNVRFQPYRLTTSQCYDADDARISCLACHDPHQQLDTNPVDYDSKCLACHAGGKVGAKKCGVSAHRCTTCHMPKIELPGAHFKFSDHRIRIVKANEPYPG